MFRAFPQASCRLLKATRVLLGSECKYTGQT